MDFQPTKVSISFYSFKHIPLPTHYQSIKFIFIIHIALLHVFFLLLLSLQTFVKQKTGITHKFLQ